MPGKPELTILMQTRCISGLLKSLIQIKDKWKRVLQSLVDQVYWIEWLDGGSAPQKESKDPKEAENQVEIYPSSQQRLDKIELRYIWVIMVGPKKPVNRRFLRIFSRGNWSKGEGADYVEQETKKFHESSYRSLQRMDEETTWIEISPSSTTSKSVSCDHSLTRRNHRENLRTLRPPWFVHEDSFLTSLALTGWAPRGKRKVFWEWWYFTLQLSNWEVFTAVEAITTYPNTSHM